MADLSALLSTDAHIAKATGLGYTPVNSIILQLQTGAHLLILLPTGIAWAVM